MTDEQRKELLQKLKERVAQDVKDVVDRAFEDFISIEQLPRYAHTFKFDPPIPKDSGPFRSMTSRLIEKLRAEKKMEYRIVEGKPGEVVAVEFSAPTDADRKAVERYAKWVVRASESPPQTG